MRTAVAADVTLELFASRKVAEVSAAVGELQVEETRETGLGGQRGIGLRIRFEDDGARFVQRMVLTMVGGEDRTGIVYMLAGFAMESQAAKLHAAFDNVMQSFRLSLPPRTLPSSPR